MTVSMTGSVAGRHAKGKSFVDRIFAASAAAQEDAVRCGKDSVVNATLGAIYDEDEKLVCLASVEKVYRELPFSEVCAYAGIMGLPDFMSEVLSAVFGEFRPRMEMAPMVTAGGSGALYCSIWNYTDVGDAVLCADWSWGNYKVMCADKGRRYVTYKMLDENLQFNFAGLEARVRELLSEQDSLLYILNTPAHNPTGYSVSDGDFRRILEILGRESVAFGKPVVLVLDVAYMDYAGDKREVRRFFKELECLPESVLTIVCYSMSKGFTFYGQRAGAMIGVSKSKEVIREFVDVNKYTARATWSNCNRGAMKTLARIYSDAKLLADIEAERAKYMAMIRVRADIFVAEAKECGLEIIPYIAGFFISIPHPDSAAVCDELQKEHIYCVPLAAGVRVAVCSVPVAKMRGLAAKIKAAVDRVGRRLAAQG